MNFFFPFWFFFLFFFFSLFMETASFICGKHLYTRMCPSIRPFVRPPVLPSVRPKRLPFARCGAHLMASSCLVSGIFFTSFVSSYPFLRVLLRHQDLALFFAHAVALAHTHPLAVSQSLTRTLNFLLFFLYLLSTSHLFKAFGFVREVMDWHVTD